MNFRKSKKENRKKKKKILFLEQKLKAFLKKGGLQEKTFLLAVSGGFDSMLMMEVFYRLQRGFPLMKLYAAYVHHGEEKTKQGRYRDQAFKRVYKEAFKRGIPFFSNLKPSHLKKLSSTQKKNTLSQKNINKNLKRTDFSKEAKEDFLDLKKKWKKHRKQSQKNMESEEAYRDFRYFVLREVKKRIRAHYIVLAHFKNDLLETRLIRLIRGTGPLGLEAMNEIEKDLLRPFLSFKKEDFFEDATQKGLVYKEDPSNRDLSFLRNWVRHQFLSSLEKVRPGSFESLFRSLENLSKKKTRWNPSKFIQEGKILYPLFLELDQEKKISVLSYYMRKMELKNYTLNHINEVLKRTKSPRKKIHFQLLKVEWELNSKYLHIRKSNRLK